MLTYQDYLRAPNKLKWIGNAIATYMRSDPYKLALDADEYEAQRNVTIGKFVRKVYDAFGMAVDDPTAANNRITSNFFHRLNTDRCQYSLGNGISFPTMETRRNEDGEEEVYDPTKEALGDDFDTKLQAAAYYALIHGDSYLYDNGDKYYVFPKTQFLPLPDEETGAIRAGVRFWSLEWRRRPIHAELYEEDGFTKFATEPGKYGLGALQEIQPKRGYKQIVAYTVADGEEIVGEQNYGELPIIPVYASDTRQSTLVGLRPKIDAFDMIQSGYANDLQECAQVYWLINNAMGMDDNDVAKLRDRLIFQHMAVVDSQNSSVTPYTQEIPFNAREACLKSIRDSMYEDFGALDVHTVAAGATNDHIAAAYQPMDQEADAFEYQVIQAVQQALKIRGLDPVVPIFNRNRISNQKEQVEMVMMAAQYLDQRTVLKKLPFVTVDEVDEIMQSQYAENQGRFGFDSGEEQPAEETPENGGDVNVDA